MHGPLNVSFQLPSVQLTQRIPYQGSFGSVGRLIGGQIIHTVKYTDDLVVLAKEEKVLQDMIDKLINPLKPELNPICYLLAVLGAHHFLHVSRIRVKLLTFR